VQAWGCALSRRWAALPEENGRKVGVEILLNDLAAEGGMVDARTLKRWAMAERDGKPPPKRGPVPSIPDALWWVVLGTVQMGQLVGTQLFSDDLKELLLEAVDKTTFGTNKHDEPRTGQALVEMFRTNVPRLCSTMGKDAAKVQEYARWLWGTVHNVTEWMQSLGSWMLAKGFAYKGDGGADQVESRSHLPTVDGRTYLFPGMEYRLFGNDETKVPLNGKERKPGGHNATVFVDSDLPNPGAPATKVQLAATPVGFDICQRHLMARQPTPVQANTI
jgi:hypothetical protein